MSQPLIRRTNNFESTAIALVLFSVAVFRLPVEMGHGREFVLGLLQTGVLISFAVVLWKINKWVSMFLVLAVVSRTVPTLTVESQHALKCVLFGLSWFYIVYKYGTETLLDVICVIAFAHFLATSVQWLNIPSMFSGEVAGLTFNPNEASALFALCFPAFLREGRVRYVLMVIIGLFMVHSSVGVLAVGVGMTYFCLFMCPSLIYWIVVGVLIFLLLFDVPSANARWTVWGNAILIYKKVWVWGVGLGHWETVARKLAESGIQLLPGVHLVWTRLHNSFLNGMMEMGFMFPLLVGGYLIEKLMDYKNVFKMTVLIIIIVCCCGNSMFRMNAVNAAIALTWMAIIEKEQGII